MKRSEVYALERDDYISKYFTWKYGHFIPKMHTLLDISFIIKLFAGINIYKLL